MSNYRQTLAAYEAGSKAEAYTLFENDPDTNDGVTFEQFCTAFDNILKRRAERKASEMAQEWARARGN